MKTKIMQLFERHLGMGEAEVLFLFLPACAIAGAVVLSHLCE